MSNLFFFARALPTASSQILAHKIGDKTITSTPFSHSHRAPNGMDMQAA
jgi:hypothetical protein